MKKKIIFLFILIIVVVGLVYACCCSGSVDDKTWIQEIFGIKESKYEIIKVENQLDDHEYGGGYKAVINVEEEQMPEFISEVEAGFYRVEDRQDDNELQDTIPVVKRSVGIEVTENHTVYKRISGVKRQLKWGINGSSPKTVNSMVVYAKPVEGVYEVYMSYAE